MQKSKIETQNKKLLIYNGMISQISGVLGITFSNVFDISRVKMLEQIFIENQSIKNISFFKKQKTNIKQIHDFVTKNTLYAFQRTIKKEGIQNAFFKGYIKQAQQIIIRHGMFFPLYEFFIKHSQKYFKQNQYKTFKQTFFASFSTRFISCFILFPFEVLRIEKQTDGSKNLSLLSLFKNASQKKLQYLNQFQRYSFSQIVGSVLFWCFYSQFKEQLLKYDYFQNNQPIYLWLTANCLTTICTSFFYYPCEIIQVGTIVLNKRLQLIQFFNIMASQIGIMGILKGYTNYLIRNFIFCGVSFGLYETYKHNYNPL